MPIARIQMPDGRVARFEVPKGTTPQQAQDMAQRHIASMPRTKVGGGKAEMIGLADSASFGLGDELGAVFDSLGIGMSGEKRPNIWNGGAAHPVDTWRKNVDMNRKLLARAQRDHPGRYLQGQIEGAFVPIPIVGGLKGTKTAATIRDLIKPGMEIAKTVQKGSTPARIAMRTAPAIVGGAVYGFNSGQGGIKNRAESAAEGAAIAGGLSLGTQAVGAGLGRLAATDTGQRVINAARRKVGRGPVSVPPAMTQGERTIVNQVNKAGLNNITSKMDEAASYNLPMTVADTDPRLRTLVGSAVRKNHDMLTKAETVYGDRAIGQHERALAGVNDFLTPPVNIPQTEVALRNQVSNSGPLYDAAYAAPGAGAIYPKIEPLLQRPSMKGAMAHAYELAAEEGVDPHTLSFNLNDLGEVTITSIPNWKTLDYVKRGLDTMVQANRAANNGRLDNHGRLINNTLKEFLGEVDSVNSIYPQARASAEAPLRQIDALNAGVDAVSPMTLPDFMRADIANLKPDQLPKYQQGYATGLAQNMGNRQSAPYNVIATPNAQQKLMTVFPEGAPKLIRQREIEREMARTAQETLGGSPTQFRNMADQAFDEGGMNAIPAIGNLIAGRPVAAARQALGQKVGDWWKLGQGKAAEQKAATLGDILMMGSRKDMVDAINEILANQEVRKNVIDNYKRVGADYGGLISAPWMLPFKP